MNQAQADDREREPIPFVADTDPLLRAEQVAEVLGVRPGMVYVMVQRGDMPAIRVGRYVRVRQSDLNAWIAGQPAIRPTVAR